MTKDGGKSSKSNGDLKRVAMLWFGIVTLILNTIGVFGGMEVLSGIVLWIARHWTALIDWPFDQLSYLFGVTIPAETRYTLVVGMSALSIYLSMRRSMQLEISKVDEHAAAPKSRLSEPLFASLLPISVMCLIVELVDSRFNGQSIVFALTFVLTVVIVMGLMSVAGMVNFVDYDRKRGRAIVRAYSRVGLTFWIGFLTLFLIGAWPWLLDQASHYLDAFKSSIESQVE